jgi:PAS domain S-box-containing protein
MKTQTAPDDPVEKVPVRPEKDVRVSEVTYRRLFEAARDGILILDAESGRINEVNPFLVELLGYSRAEMVGKTVGELSPFRDIESNKVMLLRLQKDGYVRYEDLPLETRDGRHIAVEFVSNVYAAGDRQVIQCNIRDLTERKRADAARRTSEARYRTLFDYAPDGIVIASPESRYLDANASACRMLGYTHDELVGLHAADIVVPAELPHIAKALSVIKTRADYNRNWQFRRKDGSLFAAEVTATEMPDGNLLGVIRDITERNRIDARFQRLMNSNVQGVIFWNTQGAITGANDAFLHTVGYTREDLEAGRIAWTAITPPEYADLDRRSLEEIAARGTNVPYEKEFVRKDGSRVPVLIGATTFEDNPDEGVCFVHDITERKKSEAALLRLAAIIESSDDAILGKDLDGIITSWNKGAQKIFGYSPDEIVGTSIRRLIPADRQSEEDQLLEKIKRGESVEHFETVRLAKDGRAVDVLITASPIRDATGTVVGVSKVVHDITDRMKAKREIQRLNKELELRVAERTAELQATIAELEAFSYSVSHDLRAPLRHVMGFVELLQKEAGATLSEKSSGRLKTISQAAQQMGQLIDDLLAFSRIGRAALAKTDVNLDAMVRAMQLEFQAETKDRSIAWSIQPLINVRADPALLRMVLVNLISNAVKFTGRRAEAKIEIGQSPGGEGETVTFVRDNGAGFDPKYAEKLFGVFQRLHSQAEFEGTGIGLANVARIIHRHGGRVWAESTVDHGATFYFSIPK